MIPMWFREGNKTLEKPSSMTNDECGPLVVFSNNRECISKWKMSIKERLHCFLRGYLWVRIFSGNTQPPILIQAEKTVFETEKKEKK